MKRQNGISIQFFIFEILVKSYFYDIYKIFHNVRISLQDQLALLG